MSITSSFGLRGLGQRLYDDNRQREHLKQRQFYRDNPAAAIQDPVAAYKASHNLPGNVPDVPGMQAWFGLLSQLGDNVKLSGGPSAPGSNQLRGLPVNSLVGEGNLLEIPREGTGSTLFAPGQMESGPSGLSYEQVQAIGQPKLQNKLGSAALEGLRRSGRLGRRR